MGTIRMLPALERRQLVSLLAPRTAADAMAAYYALDHPAERITLYANYQSDDRPNAFLVLARTGLDLFRPLAVPFAAQTENLRSLLLAGLKAGQPVLIDLPISLRDGLDEVVELTDVKEAEILRLDPSQYVPQINVLVVESRTPDGWPRFEIRSGEMLQAAAGLNWRGDHFSEVYVEAEPAAVARGHHGAVLSMMAGHLLGEHRIALYRAGDDDVDAKSAALDVGFRRTGLRTISAQAILRQGDSAPAED